MAYIFFALYLISCFWWFPSIGFIRKTGLSNREIRVLLGIKLIIAVACAYYFSELLPYSDYVSYNNEGQSEYELLKADPIGFLTSFWSGQDYHIEGLFNSSLSFWANIRFILIYKIIALFNGLTGGNFYLNSVLFSSLVFFAHLCFYRIFHDIFPRQKLQLIGTCFLLPSLLMYTSCVHKDGIVFLAIAMMCYIFYSFLKNPAAPGFVQIALFTLAGFTIFLFRNYVLVALLPAMFTVFLCRILPVRRIIIIVTSYCIYALLFFYSGTISASLNLPEAVIKRRADFATLEKGNTNLEMNDLQPGLTSFVANIPQALNHALMRPYLWESSGAAILLASLELFLYQLLFIIHLFYRYRRTEYMNNFNVFGILFFMSMILIIGYTIPNTGAIVRYRSIFWVFLLCPVVCCIDWQKMNFFRKHNRTIKAGIL